VNNLARQQLQHIIDIHGRQICDDPRLVEALLRDYCSECKLEINLLVHALREGIVKQLTARQEQSLPPAVINRLGGTLHENYAISIDAAIWVVESWAEAMGIQTGKSTAVARGAVEKVDRVTTEPEPQEKPEIPIEKKETVVKLKPRSRIKVWMIITAIIVPLVIIGIIIILNQLPEAPQLSSPPDVSLAASPQSAIVSVVPAASSGSQPIKAASQPKIVFWSLRDATWSWSWQDKKNFLYDNNYEIYAMDTDGRNQKQLTNDPAVDLLPRLSPDGTKILFVSGRKWEPDNKWDNNYDLFLMNSDGTDIRNLTGKMSTDTMPCWSPDGKLIAFCSGGVNYKGYISWAIWITDAEGHYFLNLTPVTDSRMHFNPTWPSWSPDGTKILFTSWEEGTYDISVMDIDYERIREIVLSPTPANYSRESWTTTGDRKVVHPAYKTLDEINRNPLIKGIRKLTLNPTGWDGGAYWSPDGQRIAYASSRRDINLQVFDIYVMNADGSNATNLTKSIAVKDRGAFNDWPTWSPDGTRIAFVSDREGQPLDFGLPYKFAWQIYVMDADGSNVTRITNNNYADGSPNWGNIPWDIAERMKPPPSAPESVIVPEATISALDLDKIHSYFGRYVAIEGEVVDWGGTGDIENRPILLYFDYANKHCRTYDEWKQSSCGADFRVVIKQADLIKFPDIYSYYGKKISVQGEVEYYKSAPAIFAQDPSQITVLK